MDSVDLLTGEAEVATELERSALSWVEVDLARLKYNVQMLQNRIGPAVSMLPVVKADAYGHGAVAVSRCLQKIPSVKGLAVASVAEGIELRSAGIGVPIFMLECALPGQESLIVDYHLIPLVTDLSMARELAILGKQKQKKVRVHIRVDSYTGNMGMALDELSYFLQQVKDMEWLEWSGIFTHLYAAYSQHDQLVKKQLSVFNRAREIAREMRIPIPMIHAASSPAILRYPEAYYNTVRPGTVIYGLPSFNGQIDDYRPVMQLKSQITNVKSMPAGSVIAGYKYRNSYASRVRLAKVALGYADASFLLNMREGEVLIRGQKVKIVGIPYMLHLLVDITGVPTAAPGDEVVFFGEQGEMMISAEEVAFKADIGTTNCEKVCFLSNRLPRFIKH